MKMNTKIQFLVIPLISAFAMLVIGLLIINFERDQSSKLNEFKRNELLLGERLTNNLIAITLNHSNIVRFLSYSFEHNISEEEIYEKGKISLDRIREIRKNFEKIIVNFELSHEEKNLLLVILDHLVAYQEAITSAIEMVSADRNQGLKYLIISSKEFSKFNTLINQLVNKTHGTTMTTIDEILFNSKIVSENVISVFIISVFLFFIFSYFLVGKLTRPIVRISSLFEQIRLEQNYSLRANINSFNTDVNNLEIGLNNLLNAIEARDYEIQLHNDQLEALVDERTKELETVRAKSLHASKLASLGEMAAGIAHEINNPLTIISASIKILKKAQENRKLTDEKLAVIIEDVEVTLKRISKIISGLKTVSRDSAGSGNELTVVVDMFNDVFSLCSEKFKNHGVRLEVDLNSIDENCTVRCDRVQLSQVFINLLGNAYDAIIDLEDRWVKVEFKEDDGFQIFKIIDSGKGISKEILDKVFTPFFTSKEIGKGTGLGLSISRNIVMNYGGSLEIDTNSPYTCFIVKLVKVNTNVIDRKVS